jgi:hypothetical protein
MHVIRDISMEPLINPYRMLLTKYRIFVLGLCSLFRYLVLTFNIAAYVRTDISPFSYRTYILFRPTESRSACSFLLR